MICEVLESYCRKKLEKHPAIVLGVSLATWHRYKNDGLTAEQKVLHILKMY